MKIVFLLLTFIFSATAHAEIKAYFSPKTISLGDSVELIISSDEPLKGIPNIEILKNDFLIGGQQQRKSSQWINGKGTTSYQISYTLFPHRSGTITVSNLSIGKEKLPPATLTVQTDSKEEPQKGNLTLSVECPQTILYPMQTTVCTLNLDDSVGLAGGQILPPDTPAGTWEQVFPLLPTEKNAKIGQRYQSIFAFTPKQSGKIKMSPFIFQGEVPMKTTQPSKRNQNLLDFFLIGIRSTATKPVQVQSNPIQLFVKEKPASYKGWWLPSPKVTLTERYDMPEDIHVGEPISRTLTLKAQNVNANDLPIPEVASNTGLKVYANPEKRQDSKDGGELTVTLTFVPTQAGNITLPEIQVPWFNLSKEKIEKATVPQKTIKVAAESAATAASKPISPTSPKPPHQPGSSQPLSSAQIQQSWILTAVAAGAAFLFGLGVALLILKRKNKQVDKEKKKKSLPDLYPF